MKIREITLSEAEAKVTRVGPDGVELTDPEGIKTTLPPEKMSALYHLLPTNAAPPRSSYKTAIRT